MMVKVDSRLEKVIELRHTNDYLLSTYDISSFLSLGCESAHGANVRILFRRKGYRKNTVTNTVKDTEE